MENFVWRFSYSDYYNTNDYPSISDSDEAEDWIALYEIYWEKVAEL